MATTLYLTSTATASPYPTTSRTLSTSAPSSEVTLGPGEFDAGMPGVSDAGQWNPSSAIADTTLAAEIDNTGSSLGTGRQGWLYDADLTGQTLSAQSIGYQLRLRANQGSGQAARVCMRVTVVTGNSGAWTTVANLCSTSVTGGSPTAGQAGWRDNGSRHTVTSTAANFTGTVDTATAHTFTSGERLLFEFGFCDGDSNTDRTWRLDYNQGSSYVTATFTTTHAGAGTGTARTVGTGAATRIAAPLAGAGTGTARAVGVAAASLEHAVWSGAGAGTARAVGAAAATLEHAVWSGAATGTARAVGVALATAETPGTTWDAAGIGTGRAVGTAAATLEHAVWDAAATGAAVAVGTGAASLEHATWDAAATGTGRAVGVAAASLEHAVWDGAATGTARAVGTAAASLEHAVWDAAGTGTAISVGSASATLEGAVWTVAGTGTARAIGSAAATICTDIVWTVAGTGSAAATGRGAASVVHAVWSAAGNASAVASGAGAARVVQLTHGDVAALVARGVDVVLVAAASVMAVALTESEQGAGNSCAVSAAVSSDGASCGAAVAGGNVASVEAIWTIS